MAKAKYAIFIAGQAKSIEQGSSPAKVGAALIDTLIGEANEFLEGSSTREITLETSDGDLAEGVVLEIKMKAWSRVGNF